MTERSVSLTFIDAQKAEHRAYIEQICADLAHEDPWKRLDISSSRLEHGLLQAGTDDEAYFISLDDHPVGVLKLKAPWLFGIYVQLFAIRSANRGSGAGRCALEELEKLARSKGFANIWLCVSAFNAPAQSFYAKNGYVPVGELTGLVVPHEDEILMRKSIDMSKASLVQLGT